MDKYPVPIAVLNCLTSKIDELVTFLPSFKLQVNDFQKHHAYTITNSEAYSMKACANLKVLRLRWNADFPDFQDSVRFSLAKPSDYFEISFMTKCCS